LLPVLGAAQDQARVAKCLAQLRQFGLALQMYADAHEGLTPAGPAVPAAQTGYGAYAADPAYATNRTWIGGAAQSWEGFGPLYATGEIESLELFSCPGEVGRDVDQEPGGGGDLFHSYLVRQYDGTETAGRRVKLAEPGRNADGEPLRAVALDVNVKADHTGAPRYNHGGEAVNVLFLDSRARTCENVDEALTIPSVIPGTAYRQSVTDVFLAADTR
jgi:hypothetical protein